MRKRLVGLTSALAMFTAVGSMVASPAYAATYFSKFLNPSSSNSSGCSGPAITSSANENGNVVYKRTDTTIAATITLKHAIPFHHYGFQLMHFGPPADCVSSVEKGPYATDSRGNTVTATLGPVPLGSHTAFYVFVSDFSSSSFTTPRVPAHGS